MGWTFHSTEGNSISVYSEAKSQNLSTTDRKMDEPFKSDKYDELFKIEKKDSTKKDSTKKLPVVEVKVDVEHIMDRIEQIGPCFGAQYLQTVVQKGEKTTVLYCSNHVEGKPAMWKTVLEPDISVPMNFVDRVNKQDPQLNRAIDVILKQLK